MRFDLEVAVDGRRPVRLPVWATDPLPEECTVLDAGDMVLAYGAVLTHRVRKQRVVALDLKGVRRHPVRGGGFNSWTVMGPVARAPDLFYSDDGGPPYAYLAVAASNVQRRTEWVRVRVVGAEAEFCAEHIRSGVTIGVTGRARIQETGERAGAWVLDVSAPVEIFAPVTG